MALVYKRAGGLRNIQITELDPGQPAACALYHETATLLIKKGETISWPYLNALKAAGIHEVYECQTEDDVLALAASTTKNMFPLLRVPVNSPAPFNIYDRDNRFLLRKGGIMTSAQRQRLRSANVENVYVDEERQIQTLSRYDFELAKSRAEAVEGKFKKEADLRVGGGQSQLPKLFAKRIFAARQAATINALRQKYEACTFTIAEFLNSLRQEKGVEFAEVDRIVANFLDDLHSDVDLFTNFANSRDNSGFHYHSASVTALCLGVGMALGYPQQELKELGVAALLHEVGMLSVPGEILAKKNALTPQERQRITDHPINALNYLECVKGLSGGSMMAIYQEHECPDRSGYPNKRSGSLIHDFARIIAVCDAYEAMTATRPFRTPFLPYRALEQLVFGTAKSRYALEAMNGLLQFIGLFPVGSWIRLSDGSTARVVGNNPEKYDRPVVSILYDGHSQPAGQPRILDLCRKPELKIADIVDAKQFQAPVNAGF